MSSNFNFFSHGLLPHKKVLGFIPYVFLFLSAVGFLDATYLAVLHYYGISAQCLLVEGCDRVLSSPYAAFGGMPLAFWGVLYYAAIFALALAHIESRRTRYLFIAAYGTAIGFFASLALLYLQIFVIKALCFYCLVSALISTLLFLCGIFVIYYKGRLFNS